MVIDWELAQLGVRPLDLAQMMAEFYFLKLFKDIDAGAWMIQGFVGGYGGVDEDFAFRTAIHIGAHLMWVGGTVPGWGDQKQVEAVVTVGRDVFIKAWQKDRTWFHGHVLECLFPKSTP